jgi:hypothetical protein
MFFMAIGGAAAALNFTPALAESPALGNPGGQVCLAPLPSPTTSTEAPTTTTNPSPTSTELITTSTEPSTTVEISTTDQADLQAVPDGSFLASHPIVATESTTVPLGLRSGRVIVPAEEGLKHKYEIRFTVNPPRNGNTSWKLLQNPCDWKGMFLGNPGMVLTKWELIIPQLKDSGCAADVFINSSNTALGGVRVEKRDVGPPRRFASAG